MAQGKRTPVETKAKVIEKKLWDINMSSRDIASELKEDGLEVSNDTVCDIINKDLPQYLRDNPEISEKYHKRIKCEWLKDIDTLWIDKEILNEYLSFIGWYKYAKEYIEWFMLQSLWKSYIRRKSLNKNTRYSILERAGFKCQACGEKPNKDNDTTLEIDHIIPYSMGWLCVENNYQVLCMRCNISKGNKFIHNHNEDEG